MVENVIIYGVLAWAVFFLGRTVYRIFKPSKRVAGGSSCGGCAKCGTETTGS